jgi:hypothetical protein
MPDPDYPTTPRLSTISFLARKVKIVNYNSSDGPSGRCQSPERKRRVPPRLSEP